MRPRTHATANDMKMSKVGVARKLHNNNIASDRAVHGASFSWFNMDTLTVRFVCLIYVIVTLVPSSLCKKCDSSMDDDRPSMTVKESYHFLDECTIIIVESNTSLTIINNTENNTTDCMLATNGTNLFKVITNGNIQNCPSDDNENSSQRPHVVLFVFEIIIIVFVAIVSAANVSMHLIYKELRTIPGILIIILCIFINLIMINLAIQVVIFYHQINVPAGICATLTYILILCGNFYEATRTSILAHFAYTMYRSYRVLGNLENKRRSLLCKYITFIIAASTTFITITIIVHATSNMLAKLCVPFFAGAARRSITPSVITNYVILIIWLLTEIIMSVIGFVLYFVNTRRCYTSTTKDFRVAIILTATVDFSITALIIFLFVHTGTSESITHLQILIALFFTAIEQTTLFMIFARSNKVMCCSTIGNESSHTTTS